MCQTENTVYNTAEDIIIVAVQAHADTLDWTVKSLE